MSVQDKQTLIVFIVGLVLMVVGIGLLWYLEATTPIPSI